jgi:hypothetical protein
LAEQHETLGEKREKREEKEKKNMNYHVSLIMTRVTSLENAHCDAFNNYEQ